nr:YadA-like family protein [Paraburkholderia sp. BCC1886]
MEYLSAGTSATDAVNVSQLTPVVNALGGGSAINNTTGVVTGPSYVVQGSTYTNVGQALGGLDTATTANTSSISTINTQITNINNGAGVKYLHVNSTLADSSVGVNGGISIGGGASTPNFASAHDNTAIGTNALAKGYNAIALGTGATTASSQVADAADDLIAIGNNAFANYQHNIAIGGNSVAGTIWVGAEAIAVGENSTASAANSVAMGSSATASAANSVALGAGSTTSASLTASGYNPGSGTLSGTASVANGEVSMGSTGKERRVTNIAAGSAATDAVNVSQLQSEDTKVNQIGTTTASALGGGSAFNSTTGAISAPSFTLTNANSISGTTGAATNIGSAFGTVDTALGKLNATVTNMTAGGAGIKYFHTNSSLADSSAVGVGSIAIGGGASTGQLTSIAIGQNAVISAEAPNAIAIGANTSVTGLNTIALGRNASVTQAEAMALGTSAVVAANSGIALGNNSSVTSAATNSVALGRNSVADRANAISVGSSGSLRQMEYLSAGTSATDAVNVSQLTPVVNALGGGSAINSTTGVVTGPSYVVQGNTYTNVGQALGGLDTATTANTSSISTINTQITNINNGTTGLVQQDATTKAITVAAATAGTSVDITGTAGTRKLTGVTAGTLSATSTDAVNGSQLNATNQNVTAVTNTVNNINNGAGLKYFHTNSTLADSSATGTDAVAIGGNAKATAANSIALGSGSTTTATLTAAGYNPGNGTLSGTASTANGEVSVGATGKERRITNIAAGSAATDAVNVSQLQSEDAKLNQSGTTTATALGGGVTYSATTGAITAPSYTLTNANTINGTTGAAANVGTALTTMDTALGKVNTATAANTSSISTINTQITNINNGATGLVQQDATTKAITVAATTAGTSVDFKGTAGTRKLTSVTAGTLNASSTDAVNGSQLYATNQTVAQNTTDIAANTSDIAKNTGDISSIDNRVTTVEGSVTNITNQINEGEIGLVKQDATTNAITVAAATAGTSVDFTGTAGTRQLKGLSAGTEDNDAVNVGQLKAAGLNTDGSGNVTNSFVAYDDATKGKVTLGGTGGTTLTNVKAAALSASSTDAVNGSQLYATNQTVAQNTTDITANTTSITRNTADINTINTQITTINSGLADAVQYDSSAHDVVTLGGTNGTTLSNVKAGVADMDAVNLGQLKAMGLNTDASGNITNAFVSYDDATKGKITLGGGNLGTTITNVKIGTLSASSMDAVNGSQLYATNQTVAQNTSDIAKNTGDISSIDNRVTNVEGSVTNITNQINDGEIGLVKQDATTNAITVAAATAGTTVDFTGTAGARELIGVAAGTTDQSAINLSQLKPMVAALGGDATINADGSITGPTYHMQGGTQSTVGSALDTLDSNMTSLKDQINDPGFNLVRQDLVTRDINVAAGTDGMRVNVSGTAGNRIVTGVAAGAVHATSVDAVNGSQLYASAASTAAAIGGGSTVNEDGTISAPTYVIGGTTVNNIGDAITNVDNRVSKNTTDITDIQTTINTMSGSVTNAVQYDSASHDKVTLGGPDGAPKVKLTNLQDAELSATSTDAVTGAQLWTTNQQMADLSQTVNNQIANGSADIATNTTSGSASATGENSIAMGGGSQASGANSVAIGDGSIADQANTVSIGSDGNERRITNLADGKAPTDAVNMRQMQSGMTELGRNAYSGVAAATALAMIPEVDQNKNFAIGVATANYKGYQASAVGASARITPNLKIKIGAGTGSGGTTIGAGASYQW